MKIKYLALLLIIISTSLIGFIGCGIDYNNLKIVTDVESVVLDLDDEKKTSQIVKATIEGADDSMLRDIQVQFKDKTIAKAEILSLDGDTTSIEFSALNAGSTVFYIVSKENSNIKSADIPLTVMKKAESMSFRNQNQAVLAGQSLTLQTGSFINFVPSKVFPCEATFTLMQPTNELWNNEYGNKVLDGVSIVDNVLNTDVNARCGVAQIEAKMANNIKCAVYVLVYREIKSDMITLLKGENEIDAIKLAVNSEEINQMNLKAFIHDKMQNFTIRTVSQDENVLVTTQPNADGKFSINAFDSGVTKLAVNVDLTNPINNEVYKTFTRYFDAEIVRIAKQIFISGPNTPASASPVTMDLQDHYQNVLGAEIYVLVEPREAKDRSFQIEILEIDGSIIGVDEKAKDLSILVSGKSYVNTKASSDYQEYEFGEMLRSDTIFYVALKDGSVNIKQNVKIAIKTDTTDESMPVVVNEINFLIKAGVTSIVVQNKTKLEMSVGNSTSFAFDYETSKGKNTGNPTFKLHLEDDTIAKIEETEEKNEFRIVGLKNGTTKLKITADNGYEIEIPVAVYLIPTEFYLSTQHKYENSNIAEETWNSANNKNPVDNLLDKGVTSLTIKQNTALDIQCMFQPIAEMDNYINIDIFSTDILNEYVEVSNIDESNKFSIYAHKATLKDEAIHITVAFSFNKQISDDVWERVESERTLVVQVYTPLTVYHWKGTSGLKDITIELYDKNSLNYNQQDLSKNTLKVFANSNATYFRDGGKIEWTTENPEILLLEDNNLEAKLTANLDKELYTNNRYETFVYASVTEYGKVSTLSCKVIITKPQMIESIEVTNYNKNQGIHLNDLGGHARTTFTLSTKILPKTAFNQKIGFMVYNAEYSLGSIPVATTPFTGNAEDAIIRLDSATPNKIIANKSGIAVVRIYPMDRVIANDTILDPEWCVDVWVVVEDGKMHPYSIYNAEEFMAIGDSAIAMTKNYVLMQSIDLSRYKDQLPLGKKFGADFSGSLQTYRYGVNEKFAILGINLGNPIVQNGEILNGLFGIVSGKILNIDFNFKQTLIDLTVAGENIQAETSKNAYVGLLAGKIIGNTEEFSIENVQVKVNNYANNANIVVTGINSLDYSVYFGALAGLVTGKVTNASTNISATLDLGASKTVAGGLIGEFGGSILGQEELLLNQVRIEANKNNNIDNDSAIGGLIGILDKNSQIYSQSLLGNISAPNFTNVGGVIGINRGELGEFKGNTEYKIISGMHVVGYQNVGGIVGLNSGIVNFAHAENYENISLSATEQASVIGNSNVGGLVGKSINGKITFSYSMSFVKQRVMAPFSTGNYFGDILGVNNVGGLVGYVESTFIKSCFSKNDIQILKTPQTEGKCLVGGLVGFYKVMESTSLSKSLISTCYADGRIITNNDKANESGELIGEYEVNGTTSNNYVTTCYGHVLLRNISKNPETITRNLIGNNISGGNVIMCCYLADTTGEGAAKEEDMTLKTDHYDTTYVYIGWSFGAKNSNSPWVAYDASYNMEGINNNLPILYDRDRGWLFNQAITDIKVSALTHKEESNLLPTYESLNTDNGSIASVVVLDNIDVDAQGERSLFIRNTDSISGMFDIQVLPKLDPKKWTIAVNSSDYSILEVRKDALHLEGAKLVFKKSGFVKLIFQSLLDATEKCEVLINVIDGFDTFDILDEQDTSILTEDNNSLFIKNGLGSSIFPHFTLNNQDKVNTNFMGIKYDSSTTNNFEFVNYPFEANSAFVPVNKPNLILAKNTILQEVFATPYIMLDLGGGKTYRHIFTDLKKNFFVKIYEVIKDAGLNLKQATITSGENLTLKLQVKTDKTSEVTIKNPVIYKNGSEVALVDNAEILTQLPLNEQENKLDELITNSYMIQLKNEDKNITEQITYKFTFDIYERNEVKYGTYEFDLTIIPSPIRRIDISHYTYGYESMEEGEASSNLISPGTKGLLKIETTPDYAFYDYLAVSSTRDQVSNQKVQLMQVVEKNGKYSILEAEYDSNGALKTQKITGYVGMQPYFNGIIYLITLVGNNLVEDIPFTITVKAMRNNEVNFVFPPKTYRLVTTFAPNATLTLDNSNGDTIAKGSVANFRLKGSLFNSTIKFSASYGQNELLNNTEMCDFGVVRDKYGMGTREEVDTIIPFYVGILANPTDSQITITLEITSKTASGGLLNPLILKYTIYIVDYAVESVFAHNSENNILKIGIRNYTVLQADWKIKTPLLQDFIKFIGGDDLDIMAFNNAVEQINNFANAKLDTINRQDDSAGSVWWFNGGSGYTSIKSAYKYDNFIVSYTTMNDGNSYYLIKGKNLVADLDFKLYFKSYYMYNEATDTYEFMIENEIKNADTNKILDTYENINEQLLKINVVNNTTDDTPDIVDSVEKFESMTAGASYMLTKDLVLDNWVPKDTAIKSLDGNGHIIYLRSFAPNENADTANYGLFSTLQKGSILKNLIIDVSYNIYVDLQNTKNVNFGFIAGVNDGGAIYNCDIVVTQSKETWTNIYNNSTRKVSENSNFVFANEVFNKMLQGDREFANNNTLASTFVLTDKTMTENRITTNIGSLVGKNNGAITNCRVGNIDFENILGSNNIDKKYAIQGINLFASGNVAGLVGENSGVVSNSYFANGTIVNYSMDIYNKTNQTGSKTGGLVAKQTSSGRIESSYAVGQISKNSQATLGGIKAFGTIGGLVHSNEGIIKNSYSNMPLSSSNAMGGFVYENMGKAVIKYSYSLSKIDSTGLINGVFTGLDEEGNVLNSDNSIIEKCYYYSADNIFVDAKEKATAISQNDWGDGKGVAFDGFTIADENSTWYIDSNKNYLGPQLRYANKIYHSFRKDDYTYFVNYKLGSIANPISIASLADWENVFNYSDSQGFISSPFMQSIPNSNNGEARYSFGNYYVNLINDIDFNESMHQVASETIFKGSFYGNGYNLAGLSYRQSSEAFINKLDFGIFNKLEKATVKNLNLIVKNEITVRARHMGTLAGSVKDSYLENITITGENPNCSVVGFNMVGALAGLVLGESEIKNIESNITVNAISATAVGNLFNYYAHKYTLNEPSLSYAGGIIGVVDLDKKEQSYLNPRVQNLYVDGNVKVIGEIVGGVIGLIAENSEAKQIEFVVNQESESNKQNIRGSRFAGGLVGENRGYLLNSRIGLSLDSQIAQDSKILSTDTPNSYIGYKKLFSTEDSPVAVGGLVGLNLSGYVNYSYSRVAVISPNAYIAGGVVGLAINAPKNYIPDNNIPEATDKTLNYLRNLNDINNFKKYLAPSYSLDASGKLKVNGIMQFSGTIKEVYTTGAVEGKTIFGGVFGAVVGAPIFTNFNEALIAGINNYDTANQQLIQKLENPTNYVGGLIGYLGFDISGVESNAGIVPLVSSYETSHNISLGTPSQKAKVVTQIADKAIKSIGNVSEPNHEVSSITFLDVATNSEDETFNYFNETIWDIDTAKIRHRFGILKSSYAFTISKITNSNELLNYLNNTNINSYGKIVNDITISGREWQTFMVSKNKDYTLASTEEEAITGRLEGAVNNAVDVNGQVSTRPATITFDFLPQYSKLFNSFFGYTKSLKLLNINFVFNFSPDLSENTEADLGSYGLLAQKSNSTYFENINVTLTQNHVLTINNLDNVGLLAGISQSCTFAHVKINGVIQTISDYSGKTDINIGGLFGKGLIKNEITGADFGKLDLIYTSTKNFNLNIGGILGSTNGILKVKGVLLNNKDNLTLKFDITANNNTNPINAGGIVANAGGISEFKKVSTGGSIKLNSANNSNSIVNLGGIAGLLNNAQVTNVVNKVNITSNTSKSKIFVGGIAGQMINNQNFIGNEGNLKFRGYYTNYATNLGDINILGSANTNTYVGGIYGFIQNELSKIPNGDERKVYFAMYSEGKIKVRTSSNRMFVGGLIGNVIQQLNSLNSLVDLDKPNKILKISESMFTGEIDIYNQLSQINVINAGGIVGNSQLSINDCMSNGTMMLSSDGASEVYAGGIVGITNNDILYSMTNTSIQTSLNMPNTTILVGAVCGSLAYEKSNIDYTYYSADLAGIFDNYAINITAKEMFDSKNFIKTNKGNGAFSNWAFATKLDSGGEPLQISLMYPKVIEERLDTLKGGYVTPYIVKTYNELIEVLNDSVYTDKMIVIDSKQFVLSKLPNLTIQNARKIIGNGVVFDITQSNNMTTLQENTGLFSVIPQNVVVSGIAVDFGKIKFNTNSAINFGVLAGSNNGLIYNCVSGALQGYQLSKNSSASFENLNNKFSNKFKTLSKDTEKLLDITLNSSSANIGGLVGMNKGSITGSFVNTSFALTNNGSRAIVGGIVGKMEKSLLTNSISQGRIMLYNWSNSNSLGGIAGQVQKGIVNAILANNNMMSFGAISDNLVRLDIGSFDGVAKDIVVNSSLGANDSIETFNSFTTNLSVTDLTYASKFNSLLKDSNTTFYKEIWSLGDATKNYGYPYLNIINSISLNTGDGSPEKPYIIKDGAELIKTTTQKALGKCFVINRDIMVSSSNLAELSSSSMKANLLNANNKVVYVNKFDTESAHSGRINISLFNTIESNKTVDGLGIVFDNIQINESNTINFGALTNQNRGIIKNCAAVSLGVMKFATNLNSTIGGLVGKNAGEIYRSWADIDFDVNDGCIGGLVGLLGNSTSSSSKSNAKIKNCFANGSISAQNTQKRTAIGALIGIANSDNTPGYSVENCYSYGVSLNVSKADSYVGALIGQAIKLNTYKTYAYVYSPYGVYNNLAMTGNVLPNTFDKTSFMAIWLGHSVSEIVRNDPKYDMCEVVKIDTLRQAEISERGSIYAEWTTSDWGRMPSHSGNLYTLYLKDVTPLDRREASSINADDLFGL